MNKGNLYVISTPIGNLKDITFRAIEILKSVDYVLSEDTRETQKLFKIYEITKPQISYRDQNHLKVKDSLLGLLSQGLNLALVSDSGTPVISDPGFKLLNEVIKDGFTVITIPGPSSITSALSISGLPTDKFSFLGFLPKSAAARTQLLKTYGNLDCTLVIFESPYRVKKLLDEIKNSLGNRYIAVCAELTKSHERIYRGTIEQLDNLLQKEKYLGEFVILVAKEGYL